MTDFFGLRSGPFPALLIWRLSITDSHAEEMLTRSARNLLRRPFPAPFSLNNRPWLSPAATSNSFTDLTMATALTRFAPFHLSPGA